MKPSSALFGVCLLCISPVGNAADLVTFDDLSPGRDWELIQKPYGGLEWNYFGVLDGSPRPLTEGYRVGMVSPNNVAFNVSGSRASFRTTTNSFDLRSAYLTAAFNGLQIRVQGYIGPAVAYDKTFTVNASAPTLIDFNYLGVDQVRFIPSPESPFAMDNLAVTMNQTPIAHVAANVGEVHISSIGHAFGSNSHFPEPGRGYFVTDLLIDQSSGEAGKLEPVSINWDTKDQMVLTVAAPPGMKFLVKPPEGLGARFGGFLWWNSGAGGTSPAGPVKVSFGDLTGTPADFSESDSVLSDSHGFCGFGISSAPFTNEFTFTSMTITGTVVAQHTGLGARNFVPSSSSRLAVSYPTPQTNDPGRFVFIVPRSPPPPIRITAMSPEVGAELIVQGQVGRTTVVEGSADLVHWTPISTNNMAFTLCTNCPYVSVTDRVWKDSPRRFYRAVEIP